MKGWVSGLVVGVVLGNGLAGAAQGVWSGAAEAVANMGQWQSSEKVLNAPDIFQIGYIEGMDDTLSMIETFKILAHPPDANIDDQTANQRVLDVLQRYTTCLNAHAHGTAKEFARWAAGTWQSSVDAGRGDANAAGSLIACK